jgi:hypothetical protein
MITIDETAAKRIATALGWEPPRKPLTHEEREKIVQIWIDGDGTAAQIIDLIEEAHSIKGEA